MKWFKVNGIEYKVRVYEPKESFTILYSDNTGRTLDIGAPMVLDPLGTFFNYSLTVGAIKGEEKSFDDLWELVSQPSPIPLLIVFPKGRKSYWSTTNDSGEEVQGFYAYVSSGDRGIKRIIEDVNGDLEDVVYDSFTIKLTATKAQLLPPQPEEEDE